MSSINATKRWKNTPFLIIVGYCLGVVGYWHFAYVYSTHFNDLYRYQQDLLMGHAEWNADQNRILAPLIIDLFQKILKISYESAYHHFMFYTFIAINMCAVVLFSAMNLRVEQGLVGIFLIAALPALLANYWWFPWTNLETIIIILVFVVDCLDMDLKKQAPFLAVLFAAWILTKETSLLFPIWLGLRFGLPALMERQWRFLLRVALTCIAMLVFASGVESGLRHWLWVSGSNPGNPSGMPGNIPTFLGTHILLLLPSATNYYIHNAHALLTGRLPWPLWGNGHWTDWPAGSVLWLIGTICSISGIISAYSRHDRVLLAVALLSLVYLFLCLALVNMPEADKLMPLVAAGAYAYALACVRNGQVGSAPPISAIGEVQGGAAQIG